MIGRAGRCQSAIYPVQDNDGIVPSAVSRGQDGWTAGEGEQVIGNSSEDTVGVGGLVTHSMRFLPVLINEIKNDALLGGEYFAARDGLDHQALAHPVHVGMTDIDTATKERSFSAQRVILTINICKLLFAGQGCIMRRGGANGGGLPEVFGGQPQPGV